MCRVLWVNLRSPTVFAQCVCLSQQSTSTVCVYMSCWNHKRMQLPTSLNPLPRQKHRTYHGNICKYSGIFKYDVMVLNHNRSFTRGSLRNDPRYVVELLLYLWRSLNPPMISRKNCAEARIRAPFTWLTKIKSPKSFWKPCVWSRPKRHPSTQHPKIFQRKHLPWSNTPSVVPRTSRYTY